MVVFYAIESPETTPKKVSSCKKDRQTLWLIEVRYAIKMDVLGSIGPLGRLLQKKSGFKKSRSSTQNKDKKVISLLSPFRKSETEIVACRGTKCNQKGCPGSLNQRKWRMQKIMVLTHEMRKCYVFWDRLTDIVMPTRNQQAYIKREERYKPF